MRYEVLQIKDIEKCDYAFRGLEFAKNHGFTLDDYKIVYDGLIFEFTNTYGLLEMIYINLNNQSYNSGFMGHSLSTSDIIRFENGETFYCESIGWANITPIAKSKKVKWYFEE